MIFGKPAFSPAKSIPLDVKKPFENREAGWVIPEKWWAREPLS
jgi:hypothetical protein